MIPKIIHYCWFGGGKESAHVLECIESWKKYLPDYEIIRWSEENFDIENSCDYVRQAYNAKKYAFVSDFVRLKVLNEYGGIYFDTDVEVVKNFDELLDNESFIGAESHYTLCTAVIACIKNTEWINLFLNVYKNLNFVTNDGKFDETPNSRRLWQFIKENYNYEWSKELVEFGELTVYPEDYFSPINCFTGKQKITSNTYSIHHFDASWKSGKAKFKNKLLMFVTRIIGEKNREKLTRKLKNK